MGGRWLLRGLSLLSLLGLCSTRSNARKYNKEDIERLRDEVSAMFHHAYDGYLRHAYPYDELRPLSCDGVDTWGSYSLTLIDALDTLAVVGNFSEFRRVYDIIAQRPNFDSDINVSVFETNIRILGGLLSGHLLARRAKVKTEPGWPCQGPLLRLAEDVAERLLPAFDTPTGMPYGTVNLRHGVPENETPVTCTAGVGTFVVEFGALSRLTGNPIYEEVALRALRALWYQRSPIGLVGNHIDVLTGKWTATDAGIGAGVDSYYEYLVKGAILLQRPELMKMFKSGQEAVEQYMKHDDWHFWVAMAQGTVSMPIFQSLEAFWPGVLSLIGDNMKGMKTIHNYHQVWKQYGFLPEFYNVAQGGASSKREGYPLRPELIESAMYLYRATRDPFLLALGEDMLHSINFSAKTECGYATVKDVRDHTLEDRMESFFLSETTKYLYLLFDVDSFVHNPGTTATLLNTAHGKCVIDAGGYIFNTEAHPIDPAALACCSAHTEEEIERHISSHMLDVLDPTGRSFQEFQGDLIPARIQQIEDAREEEDRKRKERREEYLRKMEEQRAKERETVRKRQDLDALRKQMQKEINETAAATETAVEVEEPAAETKTREQGDVTSIGELDIQEGGVEEIVGTGTVEIVPIASIYGDGGETVESAAEIVDAVQQKAEEMKPTGGEEVSSINSVARDVAKEAVPAPVPPRVSPPYKNNAAPEIISKWPMDVERPPEDNFAAASIATNDDGRPRIIPPPLAAAKGDQQPVTKETPLQQQLPLFSQLPLQLPPLTPPPPQGKSPAASAVSSPANVVEALAEIISKMLPSKRREFDYDEFRERVLKREDYKLSQEWYEDHFLMSCPAQSFLNRFSLQGEFFENYD